MRPRVLRPLNYRAALDAAGAICLHLLRCRRGAVSSVVSKMSKAFTDSHRTLLYVLFFLFETLLVASVVVLFCTDPRRRSGVDDAAGLTFWFAFVGLFIVCFILRRACRRLTVIGWLSLFAGFWSLALFPVV